MVTLRGYNATPLGTISVPSRAETSADDAVNKPILHDKDTSPYVPAVRDIKMAVESPSTAVKVDELNWNIPSALSFSDMMMVALPLDIIGNSWFCK
jgi:hypothetical protein